MLTFGIDDVVEERAELGAGQVHASVDHGLDQTVEIEFGGHLGGRGVQHLERVGLFVKGGRRLRQSLFRLFAGGDVENRADEAGGPPLLESRPPLHRDPALDSLRRDGAVLGIGLLADGGVEGAFDDLGQPTAVVRMQAVVEGLLQRHLGVRRQTEHGLATLVPAQDAGLQIEVPGPEVRRLGGGAQPLVAGAQQGLCLGLLHGRPGALGRNLRHRDVGFAPPAGPRRVHVEDRDDPLLADQRHRDRRPEADADKGVEHGLGARVGVGVVDFEGEPRAQGFEDVLAERDDRVATGEGRQGSRGPVAGDGEELLLVHLDVPGPVGAQTLAQNLSRAVHDPFGVVEVAQAVAQLKLELQPAAVSDFGGGLVDDAQHPGHAARFVAHGRERDVEEHLFAVSVALDVERPVLGGDGLAALAHPPQQGLEIVPQLGPGFPGRTAEGRRMLAADGGRVGLVVQGDVVRPPEHHDLDLGRQDQPDRVAQLLGPLAGRPQGRIGPVAFRDQPADFTACPFRH